MLTFSLRSLDVYSEVENVLTVEAGARDVIILLMNAMTGDDGRNNSCSGLEPLAYDSRFDGADEMVFLFRLTYVIGPLFQ